MTPGTHSRPRILLVRPPLRVHRNGIDYPAFIGFGCWWNAAYLRKEGFDVEVLDAFQLPDASCGEPDAQGYRWFGPPIRSFLAQLGAIRSDLAVIHFDPFGVQNPSDNLLATVVGGLRRAQPNRPVWLADMHVGGMNYIAYDPHSVADWPIVPDGILTGETENSLKSLAISPPSRTGELDVRRGISPQRLSGLNGSLYEALDLEAFSAFLSTVYPSGAQADPFGFDSGSIPIKASRGCPHHCLFCTGHAAARGGKTPWRPVPVEDLADAVGFLETRPKVSRLVFLDEAANVQPSHFDALLDLLENTRLEASFPNGLRGDALNREQVKRLAGCIGLLSLSPESGDAGVLQGVIGKRMDLEQIERVATWAHEFDLPCLLHFMIGLPGETRTQIETTLNFARRLHERTGARPLLQFVVALPGTRLYDMARENGWLPDPLPRDFNPLFQEGPMLGDGACEVSREELVAIKRRFYAEMDL